MSALLQHLPSYLGFSYLVRGISLHCCSTKAQPLPLTLDEGYLLTAAPPDLERGIAPLGPLAPLQPPLLGRGAAPGGRRSWRPLPLASGGGSSSRLLLCCHSLALSAAALPGGATPHPRSGGCAGARGPRGAIPRSTWGGAVVRRYPSSKIRSTGCTLIEQQ